MKDTSMIQKQRDLITKFWERGWACFRCDGMSTSYTDQQYMVAIKNAEIVMLNVQEIKDGGTKNNTVEESNEMTTLASIMEPSAMLADYDITLGFAIIKGWSDVWYFADYSQTSVSYKEDHNPLWRVIGQ